METADSEVPRCYQDDKRIAAGVRDVYWCRLLFCGTRKLGWVELLNAEKAVAFLDEDDLVGLEVFESVDEAAGPTDFEKVDDGGFADAEMDAKIVL